jgi:mRNA interferase MazF
MNSAASFPARGEVWMADLNPTRGHEQSGRRPVLVVSVDQFNSGPAGLLIVLPITSRAKGVPLHVEVTPPEGGLTRTSYIKCEDIRSIALERMSERLGSVESATLEEAEDRLRILLNL